MVKYGTEAIDIASRIDLGERTASLLGRHIDWRTSHLPHMGGQSIIPGAIGSNTFDLRERILNAVDNFGKAPINDQDLTVGPHHNILRL